jgi:cytochrome c-type biogenesis protein CcmH
MSFMNQGGFGDGQKKIVLAVIAVALIAACAMVGGYLVSGQKKISTVAAVATPIAPPAEAATGGDLDPLLRRLEERLKREPDDAQGWALLARTQMELGQNLNAARTYARAVAMLPDDVPLQLEQVDAEYKAAGEKWSPEATALLSKLKVKAPKNADVLWLAGKERFEGKDYRAAVGYWEPLAKAGSAKSISDQKINTALVEAKALRDGKDVSAALAAAGLNTTPLPQVSNRDSMKRLMGEMKTSLATDSNKASNVNPSAALRGVSGEVTIDEKLKSSMSAQDVVFVFARAVVDSTSSGMPVAILQFRAADLPIRFELSDNNAMSPEQKISMIQRVVVTARVSKSGDARAQPGDLEGTSKAVNVGSDGVSVVISRQL